MPHVQRRKIREPPVEHCILDRIWIHLLREPFICAHCEHTIHIAHVASVRIDTKLFFSDIFIETSGGVSPDTGSCSRASSSIRGTTTALTARSAICRPTGRG